MGRKIHDFADQLSTAFDGALIIMIGHPKRGGEGMMGSVNIENLTYAQWNITRKRIDGQPIISCWVDKMKDGQAEFNIDYVQDAGPGGVPVIRDLNKAEKYEQAKSALYGVVKKILEEQRAKIKMADMVDLVAPYGFSQATLYRHTGNAKKPGPLADLLEKHEDGTLKDNPIIFYDRETCKPEVITN
jgi:hypothetical protein